MSNAELRLKKWEKCTKYKYEIRNTKYPPRRAGEIRYCVVLRTPVLALACLPQAGVSSLASKESWYLVLCTWYLVHLLELVIKALQSAIPLPSSFLITSKKLVPKGKLMGTFGICTNLRDHPIVGVAYNESTFK